MPEKRTASSRRATVSARILYFGNGAPPPEVTLALEIAPGSQLFRITDDYITYIDDGRAFYNTLFVVGSDPARIRKFLRFYRPVLPAKAKIALVRAAPPRPRTQLLNIGFDDVIEGDVHPSEGRARARAILTRIGQAQQTLAFSEIEDFHLQHYAAQPLLGREARVLGMLVGARGSPVRCQHLATSSKSTNRPIGMKSLQVLISGLRGKLKPHLQIVSHGPAGYALVETSPARRLLEMAAE